MPADHELSGLGAAERGATQISPRAPSLPNWQSKDTLLFVFSSPSDAGFAFCVCETDPFPERLGEAEAGSA